MHFVALLSMLHHSLPSAHGRSDAFRDDTFLSLPCTAQDFSSPSCLLHLPAWPRLQHLVVREVHPTSITADELALLAAATSLRRLELTYAAANVHNGCHVAGSHAEAEPMEVRCRRLALIAVRYMCASQPPCVGRLNYSVQEMRRTLPQCTVAELGA